MPYTEKTFNQLKDSVLQSMDRLELSPMKIHGLSPRSATQLAQEFSERFLTCSIKYSRFEDRKRLRAFASKMGNSIYDLNVVHSVSDDAEMKFTYTIDFDRKDGLFTQKRSKTAVSFGRVLGDFDDNVRLRLVFTESGFNRAHIDDCDMATNGMPQSELLKYFVNKFNSKIKPSYVYFTDTSIARHYKCFKQVHDLDTCLSKDAKHYGRKVNGTYYHPLNILDKSPNIRLALISEKHHDDWEDGVYPFSARCLVKMDASGAVNGISRVYGVEKFNRGMLEQAFETDDGMTGGLFGGVYDDDKSLILIHADQLSSNSEDRNKLCWADEVTSNNFSTYIGEKFLMFNTRKDMLAMGALASNTFGVTPSYDGREVTSPKNEAYIRNDRPKPEKYASFVHTMYRGVVDKNEYPSTYNARMNDWILNDDIKERHVASGDPISPQYLEDHIYRRSVFGDYIHADEGFLVQMVKNRRITAVSRFIPHDNSLGLVEGQRIGESALEALLYVEPIQAEAEAEAGAEAEAEAEGEAGAEAMAEAFKLVKFDVVQPRSTGIGQLSAYLQSNPSGETIFANRNPNEDPPTINPDFLRDGTINEDETPDETPDETIPAVAYRVTD
jgi:hypothetical protein